MWGVYDNAGLFLVTTNSYITPKGCLVMGGGIAKEARDRFTGLDKILGGKINHLSTYGLLISENWPIGLFQVKRHYKENADLSLIRYSTNMLKMWANNHQNILVHLNFPGIGLGRLDPLDVYNVICTLPNNVNVWSNTPIPDFGS